MYIVTCTLALKLNCLVFYFVRTIDQCILCSIFSEQVLPSRHFCKQDAEGGRGCCALVHAPHVQNQGEVDQGGDGRPGGVESQTVLDLNKAT